MKRSNARSTGNRISMRLLSFLLVACMLVGAGWNGGKVYAVEERSTEELVASDENEEPTAEENKSSGTEEEQKSENQETVEAESGQSEEANKDTGSSNNTEGEESNYSPDNKGAETTASGDPAEGDGGVPAAISEEAGDEENQEEPVATGKLGPVTYVPITVEFPGQVKLTGDGFTEQRFSFGLRLDEETHTVVNEDGTSSTESVEQNGAGFIRLAGITGATVKEAGQYANFTFYETYTEPGYYKYSMYPVSYTNNAVEYDQHTFEVAVEVTANEDGTLSYAFQDVVGSYRFDHALKEDTEETQEPASTTATIEGYKVLKGRNITEGEFEIGLELKWFTAAPDVDVSRPKVDIDVEGPSIDGDSSVGVDVDDEVEDDITTVRSTLEANLSQKPSNVEMKAVGAGADGQAVPVSFTENYTLPGTYVYRMYEVDTEVNGIIYDTHVCMVRIVVTKNTDGTLTASDPTYSTSNTFTNRVASADSVAVSIGGYKVLEGRDMRENEEFTFGLKLLTAQLTSAEQTENTEEDSRLESGMQNLSIHTKSTSGYAGGLNSLTEPVATAVVKGAKDGTPKAFTFDEITYYQPGVYTYSMYEIPGSDENLTYDDTAYTVIVTVTKTEAGTLAATVEYQNVPGEVYFVNRFNGLTLSFGGKKTLIGRPMEAEEFTFTLMNNLNNPTTYLAGEDFKLNDALDSSSSVQTIQKARRASASNRAFSRVTVGSPAADDGQQVSFTFPGITFVTPGTYEFAMVEDPGRNENITYDAHWCIITVTVNADFTYSISYEGSTSFVNQYQNPGIDGFDAATAVITGTKTLFGRDMADGETFHFTLTPEFQLDEYGVSVADLTEGQDANYNNLPTTKARARVGANTSAGTISTTVLGASVSGAKDGQPVAVSFDALRFTQEGTYIFKMAETAEGSEDIVYDSHTCTVKVVVTRDADSGLLHAAVYYDGDNNFYNYLNDTTVTLTGTKTLYGRDMIEGEFQFKLSEITTSGSTEGRTQQKEIIATDSTKYLGTAAAPAAAAGETVPFAFEPITYTEPGIYNYTIEENKGMDDVEFDDRVYSVEVRVAATDEGLKVVSVTYKDQYGDSSEQADFVNYAGAYAEFQAEKRLIGRAMNNYEFQFNLTYTGYSTNTFTRTKAVVVENRDGKLLSESSNVLPQGIEEEYPTTITGYSTAAKAGAFSDISFDWATFTKPGTYYYILSEVQGNDPDITYDTTEYAVVINVTESDTEGMKNTVQYYKITGDTANSVEPCEKPSFTNVAQTVSTDLTCTKTLLGRTMEANEFSFGLYLISEPAHYNNLPTTKAIDLDDEDSYYSVVAVGAGADGEQVPFTFENVKLTQVGTYVFGVRELYNYDPTISYDTHEGTITVTVGRDTDNKLTVTDIQYTDTDFTNRVTTTTTTPVEPTEPDVPSKVDDKPEEPTPTETPDGPAATVETPNEPTEQPTEQPQVSEQPTETEQPQVSEQPSETEQPQVSEQPTETVPETSAAPTPQAVSSNGSMPQTGQDWWPMLLRAAAGILLIAAGILRNKKHRT